MQGVREGTINAPVYEIVVQDHRPVSNAIAERFGIRHESPQVFVIRDGAVLHHASHHGIAADAIVKALLA